MAHYIFNKNRLFQEYHSFFEQFSTDVPIHLKRLRDLAKENAISQPLEQKAFLYNFCAEHSKVDLLPSCPFFFEIDTGRSTKILGDASRLRPSLCRLRKGAEIWVFGT